MPDRSASLGPDMLKIGGDALILLLMRPPRPSPLLVLRPCRSHIRYHRYHTRQLTVTDPLVIYQNLVESDLLKPDEAQFRAAVE